MLRDVEIGRLAVGMYVAELDRPWLGTPFALQGFFITETAQIARLGEYCEYVRVDPRRFNDVFALCRGGFAAAEGLDRYVRRGPAKGAASD